MFVAKHGGVVAWDTARKHAERRAAHEFVEYAWDVHVHNRPKQSLLGDRAACPLLHYHALDHSHRHKHDAGRLQTDERASVSRDMPEIACLVRGLGRSGATKAARVAQRECFITLKLLGQLEFSALLV